MPESKFYVRSRGKITGPFEVPILSKLARRGMLTPVDEISEDRQTWSRAAEYENLFPSPAIPHAARPSAQPQASAEEPLDFAEVQVSTAIPLPAERYFYRQAGVNVGPVPISVLESLAKNGTLREGDPVWAEGDKTAGRADQLTLLMPAFQSSGGNYQNGSQYRKSNHVMQDRQLPNQNAVLAMKRMISRTHSSIVASGIVLGGIVLLAIHLPWFVVDGKVVGWWSALSAPVENPAQSNAITGLLVYIIVLSLSAIAIGILLPLLRGFPRAIVCLAIGGLGIFLYLFLMMASPSASAILWLFAAFFLIPVSASGIASMCRARGAVGGGELGKPLLGVLCGLAALGTLMVLFGMLPVLFRGEPFVGVFAGFAIFFISQLAILAAAVMGFVSLKPTYSPSLNLAIIICARVGISLLIVACLVMALDIGGLASIGSYFDNTSAPGARDLAGVKIWIILCYLRLLLVALLYPMVMALGLEEMADQVVIMPALARAPGAR